MRENPTRRWRACATGSATLAMVLMVTACEGGVVSRAE